jgi:hypothetical protein
MVSRDEREGCEGGSAARVFDAGARRTTAGAAVLPNCGGTALDDQRDQRDAGPNWGEKAKCALRRIAFVPFVRHTDDSTNEQTVLHHHGD